ncbi:MAG: 3-methylornithyl-N6-L-lysine dehydrogenase PylD [Clostridiales Family XIII bacterium]|jgi:pyrrolysine biosynthesis protein PylD|nr:3-methylornithyl-N6-L-lysine dehydrogenase PylD [Clostridiales Family XIII bacterium]
MTRLVTEWLDTEMEGMKRYGRFVESVAGETPLALAAKAAARLARDQAQGAARTTEPRTFEPPDFKLPVATDIRASVVRITSGLGVIGGFAESLYSLLAWLGVEVSMPQQTDVNGIYSAASDGADLIFIADDDRFICMNMRNGTIAENNEGTAYGYAEALDLMAGGIAGEKVLLLGFGPVGQGALKALVGLGASVSVYDKNPERQSAAAAEACDVCRREDISKYRLIFDATNEGGWLGADELHPDVLISAPGLPISLSEDAKKKYEGRVFSDVLQTGALVMLCRALI